MPPLKETFKEILVKDEGNEEILIVTETQITSTAEEVPEISTEISAEMSADVTAEVSAEKSADLQSDKTPEPPVDTDTNLLDETDLIPEVSIKPSRSTHRRRRGARKSEKNKKLQSQNSVENQAETELAENTMEESVTISTDTATTVSPVEKHAEWEAVPREVIVDPDSGKDEKLCNFSANLFL